MTFRLTAHQQEIRDQILRICAGFDDDYWLDRDRNGGFPHDLHRAMADGGWLGIAMPEVIGCVLLGCLGHPHEHFRAQPGGEVWDR